jgi:hypothetical protein
MYGSSPPKNHMGFGSPPGLGSSPKQYSGSLSVGDMGGWMSDGMGGDGNAFADTSGFYGDNVVIDDSMMMMGGDAPPSLSLDEPPVPTGGRLSIDTMPQGMMGGLGEMHLPVPLQAGPEADLPPQASLRGSPLATSDTAISGSPLARFAGANIQPVTISTETAAPPAATKPVSRRKPAANRETSDSGRVSKKPWNDDEDMRVIELVSIHGAKNWPLIADHLPGRVGKQCRERCARETAVQRLWFLSERETHTRFRLTGGSTT